jgi:hypothetical protein
VQAITSIYDAVITRVVVSEGRAVVAPGDRVLAGAELVSTEILDTQGALLKTVMPKGAVYGRVAFMRSAFFTLSEVRQQRTGRTSSRNSTQLFGWSMGSSHSPYELYESIETEQFLFGRSFLPIIVRHKTYHELVGVEYNYTVQERQQQLLWGMQEMLVLQAGGRVIASRTDVREVPGGYRLDAVIEAEMRLNF